MNQVRSLSSAVGLLAAVLLAGTSAWADPKDPVISQVLVNNVNHTITIQGSNLFGQDGPPAPKIFLSGVQLTLGPSPTAAQITATLPANLSPGSYLVSVIPQKKNGENDDSSHSAFFDVAIGAIGPQGPQGLQGLQGFQGPQGAQGPMGLNGATGAAGLKGDTGATGAVGLAGAKGDMGMTGATGPAGVDGAAGPAGPKGDAGVKGDIGAVGPAGLAGTPGSTGPAGPTGAAGTVGATGPQGAAGPAGPQGANTQAIALLRWYDANQTTSFPVGATPRGVAFDGANIWVANANSNNVTKLRASDGALLGTFAAGSFPERVAFDGANKVPHQPPGDRELHLERFRRASAPVG